MFIEVIKAEYMDGYRLLLLFNNGERRIVDLSNSLRGTVYTPLKDVDYFKRFSIKFNTVEWENGADFAPECMQISKMLHVRSNFLHRRVGSAVYSGLGEGKCGHSPFIHAEKFGGFRDILYLCQQIYNKHDV